MFSTAQRAPAGEPDAEVFFNASVNRAQELSRLVSALADFDARNASRADFTELFKLTVRSLEMSEEELADLLDTTRSTINRWENGRNVPSRSVRKPVFSALANNAKGKLKRYKSIELSATV